jgi:hypothetical protein
MLQADKHPTPLPKSNMSSESIVASSVKPLEVTLSTLLMKNLVEYLAANLELPEKEITSSLEKITLEIVSNISRMVKNVWNSTAKQYNNTLFTLKSKDEFIDIVDDVLNSSANNDGADDFNTLGFNSTNSPFLSKEQTVMNDW